MVKSFNEFVYLNERRGSDILWHVTRGRFLHYILKDNNFKLSIAHTTKERTINKGFNYYFSTARTITSTYITNEIAGNITYIDKEGANEFNNSINFIYLFKINGFKLNNMPGIRIIPVDFFNRLRAQTHEAEDRIISNNKTLPLSIIDALYIIYYDPNNNNIITAYGKDYPKKLKEKLNIEIFEIKKLRKTGFPIYTLPTTNPVVNIRKATRVL